MTTIPAGRYRGEYIVKLVLVRNHLRWIQVTGAGISGRGARKRVKERAILALRVVSVFEVVSKAHSVG